MSCRASRSDPATGFTLLEALVALAILGAVLGVIGSAVATTIRGIRNADMRLMMNETGHVLLASIPRRDRLNVGTQTGELGEFRWRMDVRAMPLSVNAGEAAATWQTLAIDLKLRHARGAALQMQTYRLVRVAGAQ